MLVKSFIINYHTQSHTHTQARGNLRRRRRQTEFDRKKSSVPPRVSSRLFDMKPESRTALFVPKNSDSWLGKFVVGGGFVNDVGSLNRRDQSHPSHGFHPPHPNRNSRNSLSLCRMRSISESILIFCFSSFYADFNDSADIKAEKNSFRWKCFPATPQVA